MTPPRMNADRYSRSNAGGQVRLRSRNQSRTSPTLKYAACLASAGRHSSRRTCFKMILSAIGILLLRCCTFNDFDLLRYLHISETEESQARNIGQIHGTFVHQPKRWAKPARNGACTSGATLAGRRAVV